MATHQYLALLRGINVGGNNIIKMTDLKACFESHGFGNVATYIQSGNVLFESDAKDTDALTSEIETLLSKKFGYKSKIVLRSHAQMKAIVSGAPKGYGTEPTKYRYDVMYLKDLLTAQEALVSIELREGVDAVAGGDGVLYHSRLIAKATQSRISKVVMLPVYQNMTIRNWNTTTKLLAKMDERQEESS